MAANDHDETEYYFQNQNINYDVIPITQHTTFDFSGWFSIRTYSSNNHQMRLINSIHPYLRTRTLPLLEDSLTRDEASTFIIAKQIF